MVKKRKTAEAWKKKEWYSIYSPKMFDEKNIGTTPAEESDKLINRVIKVPLTEITENINHQFIKLWFRITDVKSKNAYTELDGFELTKEYLRRNIRRRKSIVKLVKELETKDGKKMQVTVYAFTARKINTSKKNEIRQKIMEKIEDIVKTNLFETLVEKLILGGIASEIFKEIKIISPIKRIEIAKCEVLRGK